MDWPMVDTELLSLLPPVLKAVVKALGYVRAREWLETRGGVNVNIPVLKGEALGLKADEMARLRIVLAAHMDAAGRVSMPKADKLWQVARNVAICKTSTQYSIRDQALAYRLTGRQITNIRRNGDTGINPAGDGQLDLF
ncbi:hypothetical protein [Azonexus sp.]|uniref:hypothetical protein n=1 Tax=Azonexus sp. TaxID=1872668 RepID=UPI0027B8A701|nr:hypothetical protein [Azonexus sp.]